MRNYNNPFFFNKQTKLIAFKSFEITVKERNFFFFSRNKRGLFETIAVESASMVLRNYHKPFFFFKKQKKLISFKSFEIILKERNFFFFSRKKRGVFETIAVASASMVL